VQARSDWRHASARDEQEEWHGDLAHEWSISRADGACVSVKDRARGRLRESCGLMRGSGRGVRYVLRRTACVGAKAVSCRTALLRQRSAPVCRTFDPVPIMMRAVSRDRCARTPVGAGALEHRVRVLGRRDELDARRGGKVLTRTTRSRR
jgi:hypothetical protein